MSQTQTLKDRIGIDLGRRISVEEGISWTKKNNVYYIDAQTDIEPNAVESFDDNRCKGIRDALEGLGFTGHHTNGFTTLPDMLQEHDYIIENSPAKPE